MLLEAETLAFHLLPNMHFISVQKTLLQHALQMCSLLLCVCKHFACVPVHGGMSGESCAEPVSIKQRAVRKLAGR